MNGIKSQSKNVYMVKTNVRKWGNSQGIRLSKELMSQMNLNENDTIGISVNDGKMTIEKLNGQKYFNLKPIDEVFVENTHEVDMDSNTNIIE